MENIINSYKVIYKNIINDKLKDNIINKKVEKIFVINLYEDVLREKYIELLMKRFKINYTLIKVYRPHSYLYKKVIRRSKPLSKKMTNGEVGCYLSHMWCLNQIIKNNYKNAIIFEDDIIVHKDIVNLFKNIVINDKEEIEYDFLMLGAADHGFNNGNKELIKNNIYIPKNYVIMGTHAIYYSNYGAKILYDYRLKYPVYFDKNLKEIFTFFEENKTGVCYPNLFTVENSTTNIGHEFGISKYKYNNYYYKQCYDNFNFKDYHFIYLDLFPKFILEDHSKLNTLNKSEYFYILLMNYFNNEEKVVKYHLDKLDFDLFNINEYNELLKVSKNEYTQLYYKNYKEICEKENITSGKLLLNGYKNKDLSPWKQDKLSALFHKETLNIVKGDENIEYEIIKEIDFIKKNVAHLHCFCINRFHEIYGNYIDKIKEKMDIIITYSEGSIENIINCNYLIVKVENRGMDIGAKFVIIDYLKKCKKEPENILFLHSKSDIKTRSIYFDSLVNNLNCIDISNDETKNIGGIFPPTIHMGDDYPIIYNEKYLYESHLKKVLYEENINNLTYIKDLLKYFNFETPDITLWCSGNCYILNYNIATIIFGDKRIYNCFNQVKSFDYNWVKNIYNIKYDEVEYVYEIYKKLKLNGNCLQLPYNQIKRDGMVEHAIERIIFKIIIDSNMEINILPNEKNKEQIISLSKKINECYKTRIKYKYFDWKQYNKDNPELEKYQLDTKEKAWSHWTKYGWYEDRKIK